MAEVRTLDLPAWKNQDEYTDFDDPRFKSDESEYRALIERVQELNKTSPFGLEELVQLSELRERAWVVGGNLSTFVNCELSLDAQNAEGRRLSSQFQRLGAGLSAALVPAHHALMNATPDLFEAYLKRVPTEEFTLREARRRQDLLLQPAEEQVLASFKPFGLRAWGDLYNQLSGQLRVGVDSSQSAVGLAQAQSLLRDGRPEVRRAAWQGIQNAWAPHAETVAAILNALAGFRLEEYQQRSRRRAIDFLDVPLNQSRIERKTLDAMFSSIDTEKSLVTRALSAMARALKVEKLDACDLLAPAPGSGQAQYTFAEALDLVTEAFARISPEMGAFVQMMADKGWIEARVLPRKRGGAYCTGFPKSRTPRVFQTFLGSYQDVSTLAHELGHAWHGWTMRDLPSAQRGSPMTLAETASVFAETALADYCLEKASADTQVAIAFAEASDAVTFLANIRARFEFEKSFYVARARGALGADELNTLMETAFRGAYGEALGEVERQFWMTKLHFSISSLSFYNYPYTFGYLFSLGIYERRAQMGQDFPASYRNLLCDTGRMTAETLIAKHLGGDIGEPEFWRRSLRVVESKIARFESLLGGAPGGNREPQA